MFNGKKVQQKFSARHLSEENARVTRATGRVLARQLVALRSFNDALRATKAREEETVIRNSWGASRVSTI